jgi:hypothetical protein
MSHPPATQPAGDGSSPGQPAHYEEELCSQVKPAVDVMHLLINIVSVCAAYLVRVAIIVSE